MSKYAHWCDNEHQRKENKFDVYVLSQEIVQTLTDWILHDFTINEFMTENQIELQRNRMKEILHTSETIEAIIVDANSIYAIYDIDFEERRKRWLEARGLCYRLTVILSNIVNYASVGTNTEKYLQIENKIKELSGKIKSVMIADDKKKKTHAKPYIDI